MANYSVNQNRQVYVANNGYSAGGSAKGQVIKAAKTAENELYFLFNGADTVLKSDYIPLANITFAKAIDAADMVIPMKKIKVALAATVNSGNIVSGQDYVLGINFKNFFSSGDASQYYKCAAVHGTAGMTATQFYTAMKNALNAAFSREDGATASSNPYLSFDSDANGIYIQEKPQEWELGTKKARRIMFDVLPSTIYTGGDDVIWGTITDQTPAKGSATVGTNAVGNGQQIADLEWFALGERGDQYRNVGWPNVIPTKYLADPTKQYHTIEIHYSYTGSGISSYKSEKEITIAVPKGAASHEYDDVNAIIGALNTAAGSTIITTLS